MIRFFGAAILTAAIICVGTGQAKAQEEQQQPLLQTELPPAGQQEQQPAVQQEPPQPAPQPKKSKAAPAAPKQEAKPAPAPAKPNFAAAEWEFFRKHGGEQDEDAAASLLAQVSGWQRTQADTEYGDDALLLAANLRLRLGDYRSAIMDLLGLLYEYPSSEQADPARQLLNSTIDKKMGKKFKPVLADIARDPGAGEKAERRALLLKRMSEQAGEEFYEPLDAAFREYFWRFPDYAKRDELQLALGNFYLAKEEFIRAKLEYEKLLQVYPSSQYVLQAKKALADITANNLKQYGASIPAYQDIAAAFPGTPEAWQAYQQVAKLAEKQKQYDLAVETYEKIIALYPEDDATHGAYRSEARVLREDLAKPREAFDVLNRLADKYKDQRSVEALNLAAEIARKDLKDGEGEIKMYDRIAAEYPSDPQAPKAIFYAGQTYEKLLDYDKAREYYNRISDKYPDDPMAKKALKAINSLLTK